MHLYTDRAAYCELARQHTFVPVSAEVLADMETPVSAFRKVVGDENGFLLESVESATRWGRYSFLGTAPRLLLTARDGRVEFTGRPFAPPHPADDPLQALERQLAALSGPALPGLPPLTGGAVGYLAYDVVRYMEDLPCTTTDDLRLPEMVVAFTGTLVVFDHFRQRLHLIEGTYPAPGDDLHALYDEAVERLGAVAERLARPLLVTPVDVAETPPLPADVTANMSSAQFEMAVDVAKEYIRAGDIFQVVLSKRYEVALEADPFHVYRVLRLVNPSPYMYFVREGGVAIAGSSPESMVKVRDGRVEVRPIAGTKPRGSTEADDAARAGLLLEDPKERAEHVMLVDLARNDVGRIAKFGTRKVDEFFALERYSHVMHIVSSVSGELRAGIGPIDVLRATFPAGTLSGAPKVRAMEIIDELEDTRRGPYGGVVGYFDYSGNLDTAITIRTLVATGATGYVQAGAGIVHDSDPASEDDECRRKANAVLAAVAGAADLHTAEQAARAAYAP